MCFFASIYINSKGNGKRSNFLNLLYFFFLGMDGLWIDWLWMDGFVGDGWMDLLVMDYGWVGGGWMDLLVMDYGWIMDGLVMDGWVGCLEG